MSTASSGFVRWPVPWSRPKGAPPSTFRARLVPRRKPSQEWRNKPCPIRTGINIASDTTPEGMSQGAEVFAFLVDAGAFEIREGHQVWRLMTGRGGCPWVPCEPRHCDPSRLIRFYLADSQQVTVMPLVAVHRIRLGRPIPVGSHSRTLARMEE